MGYELIITEKPNAAKKIAQALADGKAMTEKINGIAYYKVTHGKRDIVVGCAVGHLYGLAEKNKGGWTYPVFDIEWKPAYDVNKASAHTKKYLAVLKKLGKGADEFTIATDYDVEGEVIGYTILHNLFKQKDGNRMKFSTLTAPDLKKAYETKSNSLDWGQANAGVTRHELDWYYGINLSRALTRSVKAAGSFKLLSSGRVQGPALKIIVTRENEISEFNPVKYWQIFLNGKAKGEDVEALHESDKLWKKEEADAIFSKTKDKPAKVSNVKRTQFKQKPPVPFDLTTLQTESYKCLRLSPKETLSLAQELYTQGLISYPRTSSQQLPPEIDLKKILNEISQQEYYKGFAEAILKKGEPKPNNGKKTDPAHPAIYPTGAVAFISDEKAKLYDLIVRRFLATMGDDALRETMEVSINVNDERFVTKGTRTVEKGWHEYYGPHVKMDEVTLPSVDTGDSIDNPIVRQEEKQTLPPKRYTPASIIKELEKRNLGTKSTRAQIVDTLFQRGYVYSQPIQATKLGILTAEILEKYAPTILDEDLTKTFEERMVKIREGTEKGEDVLKHARKVLTEILDTFAKKEKEIGAELITANRTAQDIMNFVGMCPACDGGKLMLKPSKFGKFIGCTNYPDCKQTYKIPAGLVKPVEKPCETCNSPMIMVIQRRRKPQFLCLNPDCPTKQHVSDEEEAKWEKEVLSKPCPKCGSKLVLRKSLYGKFIGCSDYPKCKHTETIE